MDAAKKHSYNRSIDWVMQLRFSEEEPRLRVSTVQHFLLLCRGVLLIHFECVAVICCLHLKVEDFSSTSAAIG